MKGKKVALLTLQHFANAPRAQKEAGSLARAGADVTVFGSWWNDERAQEDLALAERLGITYIPLIDLRNSPLGLRIKGKIAREAFKRFGIVLPEVYGLSARAMIREIKRLKPDLTMVHCEPGLWAGPRLIKAGFKVGIDFEDWFSEDLLPEARKERPVGALAAGEKYMLKNGAVNFATTEAMAANLSNWAGLETTPTSIPNTFPWADSPKKDINADKRDPNCVSFYWFSQTIGPGRGLEILGHALSKVRGNWQLHLRGTLRNRQDWFEETFPESIRDRVIIQPIVPNRDLPTHSASHDIGLALEDPFCKSRDLTATNKIFEYMRCGLATIATRTSGQIEVLDKAQGVGWIIEPKDEDALIERIQFCLDHPDKVAAAKSLAKEAAAGVWSWEAFEPILVEKISQAL
ncbi:MAG: glycosyltransferase [Akkermansiaceae bacterium]|nr:glycosyltransferase [Akkermansiaceae bacterium]